MVTGRPILFVNPLHTHGFQGMAKDEAWPLIEELAEHATQDRFVYYHAWRVGDMLMWDEQATMHRGAGDYRPTSAASCCARSFIRIRRHIGAGSPTPSAFLSPVLPTTDRSRAHSRWSQEYPLGPPGRCMVCWVRRHRGAHFADRLLAALVQAAADHASGGRLSARLPCGTRTRPSARAGSPTSAAGTSSADLSGATDR